MTTPQGQLPTDTNTASGAADSDDSLMLCASDLQHSAIYDNHVEMQSCLRAVADRIAVLARASHGQAPAQPVDFTTLGAAMRAIQQAIGLIGDPADERMQAVRRVLRGAVVVAEDSGDIPAQPDCLTCNDHGAVGNILTAEPCPDCTPTPPAADTGATAEPYGWLYDWTHSSATGRPDETYTGFTKDEQHARKHDNCTPVYTAPHPALSAGWQPIETAPKDGTPLLLRSKKGRIADGAWITATSSCSGWAWAYVNLEPIEWQPLPVEPSMDGESNG